MKFRGGYNILLKGEPSGVAETMPQPGKLYLPLKSRRFCFSEMCVDDGAIVLRGDVLGRDKDKFSLPLLAPAAGTVRLGQQAGHIVIELDSAVDNQKRISDRLSGFAGKDDFNGRCEKLVELGAWQFLYDAHTGKLPQPGVSPQAVIVSTLHLEPYTASSLAHLGDNLDGFIGGLEHLQSLLEYQPIYLGVSDPKSELANELRRALRGHAWVKFVAVPRKYPNDNFAVLVRHLELKADAAEPVWALRTEGVLAINEVMSQLRPCTNRIISIAGPAVKSPRHLKVMVGHPLDEIFAENVSAKAVRVINGGVLTGTIVGEDQRGLDVECQGLTVLEDEPQREFLSFVRSGFGNRSYSKCFLSSLRKPFKEAFDTSQRGELRPCIDCGYCEEVCPVGIMPHLIHKYLYQDELEEAVQAGLERCVLCGLCSFVCTSKINLKEQFRVAQETVVSEQLAGR